MDRVPQEKRSEMMSRVRGKDSRPEMILRRLVSYLGYRYRLHRKDLPGKPDLVFPGRKKAIFVHGCFWHRHDCTAGRQIPKSRQEFWVPKLARNAGRDKEVQEMLHKMKWGVLVVWSCQLKEMDRLESILIEFLGPTRNTIK